MTAAASPPGGRVDALDGLRGCAIALVMLYHFFTISAAFSDSAADRFVSKVAGAGWCGVDLFFVLSGFLITGILFDAKTSAAPFFRTFYARRVLRIFPAYYVFLALLLFVVPSVQDLQPSRLAESRDIQGWYWAYLTNVRIAIDGGARDDLLETWHLWSLAIEEQFYLVWPALVLLLSRTRMLQLCAACIGGAFALRIVLRASGVDPVIIYTLTPARIDALAAGAAIALLARSPGGLRRAEGWTWPLAATGTAVVVGIFAWRGRFSPYDVQTQVAGFSALVAIAVALLVKALSARPGGAMYAVLSAAPARDLGRYSYALYIVHWPAVLILTREWDIVGAPPGLFGTVLPGRLLLFAVAFAVSYAVAFVSWHVMEKQVLRLKQRFPYSTSAAAAPASSPAH